MAITETTGPFGSNDGAKTAALLPYSSGRTPLNIAAAQVAAQLKHRFITPGFLSGMARLADFVGLALVSVIILSTYVDTRDAGKFGYALASLVLPAVTVIVIGSVNGYAVGDYRRAIIRISRGVAIWGGVFGFFTLALFFLKMGEDFSRVWLASWFIGGAVVLSLLRVLVGRVVAKWQQAGILERRAVLVGGGPEAVELIQALRKEPTNDIRIVGIFDDRTPDRIPALAEGYPRLGRIDELLEFGRQAEVDMLIMALPMAAEARLMQLLKTFSGIRV